MSVTALHPETIPHELTARNQWVCWRYEDRNGKRTKAPINARSNGRLTYAKSNDPKTWAPFDTAVAACGIHPELAGFGFCFASDDRLAGIDLDHVFNPDAGELKPEAAEIAERFAGTYIEVSPSGTGIRIFCKGKPRRSGKNIGPVKWCEVYAHPSSRYLTVTGNRWNNNVSEVTDQQAALDWLHARFMESTGQSSPPVDAKPRPADSLNLDDAELLDKARRAKNGADFERLWAGDLSAHGGDASAADLALCNSLAFYTGNDPARIDRLFRQSALFRPVKWDKPHRSDGATYGRITIEKAISGNREVYSGRKPDANPARPMAATTNFDGAADAPPPAAEVDPVADEVPERSTCVSGKSDTRHPLIYEDKDGKKKLVSQQHASKIVFQKLFESNLTYDAHSLTWLRYQPELGIFSATADAMVGEELFRAIRRYSGNYPFSSAYVSGVLKCLTWESTAALKPRPGFVAFKNGALELSNRTLHDHSPQFGFRTALPFEWCPDLPAPELVIDWLREAVGGYEDQVQLLRAYIAAVITGRPDLQRFLELVGFGGSGKGTFIRLLTALVGGAAVHSTTIKQLEENRFETAKLYGKKLVVITDAERWHNDVSTLKAITGQDPIRFEEKHRQAGDIFTFDGMVVIASNQYTEGTDYSSGIQRRRITLRFDHVVPAHERRDLDAEFEPYLGAVAAWALRMPTEEVTALLRSTSTHVPSLRTARMDALAATNPVAGWMLENCEFGPFESQVGVKRRVTLTTGIGDGDTETQSRVVYENSREWLYPNYVLWCDSHGKNPLAHNAFANTLVDVAKNLLGQKDVQRSLSKRRGAWMEGIRVVPEPAEVPDTARTCMNSARTYAPQVFDCDELHELTPNIPKNFQEQFIPPHVAMPDDPGGNRQKFSENEKVRAVREVDNNQQLPVQEFMQVHADFMQEPSAAPSPGKTRLESPAARILARPLPPDASSDARELWKILSLYRGAETAVRLARKLGWGEGRAVTAAQELSNVGRARISGDCIAPIHPPIPDAGQRDYAP